MKRERSDINLPVRSPNVFDQRILPSCIFDSHLQTFYSTLVVLLAGADGRLGFIKREVSSETYFAESTRHLFAAELINETEGMLGIEPLTLHAYRSLELALQGYARRLKRESICDSPVDEILSEVLEMEPRALFLAETMLLLQNVLDDMLLGSGDYARKLERPTEVLQATQRAVRSLNIGDLSQS